MMTKLFRDTKDNPQLRTIRGLVKLLDKSYALTGRGREMASLEKLFELKREPMETMQSFWLRFDMILGTLEGHSSLLSSELLFYACVQIITTEPLAKDASANFP